MDQRAQCRGPGLGTLLTSSGAGAGCVERLRIVGPRAWQQLRRRKQADVKEPRM